MRISLLLIVGFIVASLVETRKKKKKQKQPQKPTDPLDKRPTNIKPELYCDACVAMVKETVKELRGKKKESDVLDVVENVCDPQKYYSYHHPPPEMKEGCESFIAGWEDELVSTLVNRQDEASAVQKLCYEVTKACTGVDPGNVKPFDDTIMVDGQPQKIGGENQKEDI